MNDFRRNMILIEMMQLLEDRVDFLRQRFVPLLQKMLDQHQEQHPDDTQDFSHLNQPGDSQAEQIFNFILSLDPDPRKSNSQWLLQTYLKGNWFLEDAYKVEEYLPIFMKFKNKMPVPERDLNKYKSVADLYLAVKPYMEQETQGEINRKYEKEMHKQAKVVFNDAEYKIVIPLTKEASCYFGKNTQWCTAATGSYNYFDSYNKRGPLYIILDKKNNQRWQFQPSGGHFMDENDHPMNLDSFIKTHPKVAEIFEQMDDSIVIGYIGEFPVVSEKDEDNPNEYAVKTRGGLLGRQVAILLINDDRTSDLRATTSARGTSDMATDEEEVKKFLMNAHMQDRITSCAILNGAYLYFRNGRWGTVEEVGDVYLKSKDGSVWKQVAENNTREFTNVDANGSATFDCFLKDKELSIQPVGDIWKENNYRWSSNKKIMSDKLSGKITDFILSFSTNELVRIVYTSAIVPRNLTQADKVRIVNERPDLADVETLYRVKGNVPEVKEKIDEWLYNDVDDGEHSGEPYEWMDNDHLIVKKFDNIEQCALELADDSRDNSVKWFVNVMSGDERPDYWDSGEVDTHTLEDFMKSLRPEEIRQVGEYLLSEHPEDAEMIDDYDPNSIRDIVELASDTRDDAIYESAKLGVTEGRELGAQNEISEIFWKTMQDQENLYCLNDGKYTHDLKWDTPVVLVAPVSSLVEMIANGVDQIENWGDELNARIEMSEPYGGFTDFDNEAAHERFAEQLYENDVLNRVGSENDDEDEEIE